MNETSISTVAGTPSTMVSYITLTTPLNVQKAAGTAMLKELKMKFQEISNSQKFLTPAKSWPKNRFFPYNANAEKADDYNLFCDYFVRVLGLEGVFSTNFDIRIYKRMIESTLTHLNEHTTREFSCLRQHFSADSEEFSLVSELEAQTIAFRDMLSTIKKSDALKKPHRHLPKRTSPSTGNERS